MLTAGLSTILLYSVGVFALGLGTAMLGMMLGIDYSESHAIEMLTVGILVLGFATIILAVILLG